MTILYIKIMVWCLYNQGKSSITWESHISEIDLEQKHGGNWSIEGGITENFSLQTQKSLSSQQQSTCCALRSTPSWSTCAGVWSCTGASILTRACADCCIGKHKILLLYQGITGTVKAYRVKRSRAYYSCWIILGAVSGDVHVLFSQKCFWLWAHTIDSNKQNHSETDPYCHINCILAML